MAQSISLWGAAYSNVPAVDLPKTTSGTARFTDTTIVTATTTDVVSGKIFVDANGAQQSGGLVIQHYYTGSSAPPASLGVDGDIYLQTGG